MICRFICSEDTYCQYQKAKSKLGRHGKDGAKESKVEEHDVGMTPSMRTANTAEVEITVQFSLIPRTRFGNGTVVCQQLD